MAEQIGNHGSSFLYLPQPLYGTYKCPLVNLSPTLHRSLIFIFLALFASVWHTGTSSPGSPPPPLLPIELRGLLRFVIMGWIVVDIGLGAWTIWTVRRIGAAARERTTHSSSLGPRLSFVESHLSTRNRPHASSASLAS